MKMKIMIALGGLLIGIGAYFLKANMEVDYTTDALAGTAPTSLQTVACTDPTQTASVPAVDYTITWTLSATADPVPAASLVLTGPVMSDTAPTVIATLNATGAAAGSVTLTNPTSQMKIDGIACQAVSQAQLQVNGDGTDNTNFDVAIQNLADANGIYTAADKVDDAPSTTKDMLFGTSGQIQAGLITDVGDRTAVSDSQIQFGGTTETAGGSETHNQVDITNYDVTSGTDRETLTFTFTGS